MYGRVLETYDTGALLRLTTAAGVPLCRKAESVHDGDCIVEVVNGESLF